MEAILPISFSPLPKAFPVAFEPLVRAPMTAPIVVPAGRMIAATVRPYFWKISFTLSKIGLSTSNSSSRAVINLFSSSRVFILSRAASFSSGEAFLSFKIFVSSSLSFSRSSPIHLYMFYFFFQGSSFRANFCLENFFFLGCFCVTFLKLREFPFCEFSSIRRCIGVQRLVYFKPNSPVQPLFVFLLL